MTTSNVAIRQPKKWRAGEIISTAVGVMSILVIAFSALNWVVSQSNWQQGIDLRIESAGKMRDGQIQQLRTELNALQSDVKAQSIQREADGRLLAELKGQSNAILEQLKTLGVQIENLRPSRR